MRQPDWVYHRDRADQQHWDPVALFNPGPFRVNTFENLKEAGAGEVRLSNNIASSIFADRQGEQTVELHEDGRGECGLGRSTYSVELEPMLWEKLAELAQAEAITAFSITSTAFALLLERLAGGPISLSVQATPGTKQVMFPLALRVNKASDFVGVAANLSRLLEKASLGSVAEDTKQGGYAAYTFAWEDGDADMAEEDSRGKQPSESGRKLCLTLCPGRAKLHARIRLSYDPACFSAERSESLVEAYTGLLRSIVAAPHRASAEYQLAYKHDRARGLPHQSPASHPYALGAPQRNLSELFDAIVSRWPAANAAAWPGGSITFAEISDAAHRVLNALRQKRLRRGR